MGMIEFAVDLVFGILFWAALVAVAAILGGGLYLLLSAVS